MKSTGSTLCSISESKSKTSRRSSRNRSGHTREDAQHRLHDNRQATEAAIHVLDNGVNRTPAPLQKRHSVVGLRGGRSRKGSSFTATDLNSSFLQSSFLNSSEANLYSKSSVGLQRSSSTMNNSSGSSLHSQSHFAPRNSDQFSTFQRASSSSNMVGVGLSTIEALGNNQTMFDGALVGKSAQMTEPDRRAWMKAKTTITLSETPTIFLYSHQDEAVCDENAEEALRVSDRNKAYSHLEDVYRMDEGTRFQQKGTITFAPPKKSIHCEVQPPRSTSAGALQVTTWMLKDEYWTLQGNEDDAADGEPTGDGNDDDGLEGKDLDEGEEGDENSVSEVTEDHSTAAGSGQGGGHSAQNGWMFADSLMSNLRIMERAVVQNYMEELQLAYRGITLDPSCSRLGRSVTKTPAQSQDTGRYLGEPRESAAVVAGSPQSLAEMKNDMEGTQGGRSSHAVDKTDGAAPDESIAPPLRMTRDITTLWSYHSPLTEGRSVTCMAWNRKEPDILAVGYSMRRAGAEPVESGKPGDGIENNGMICCWTLKNPLAPELVLHLRSDAGVSSLAFSAEHPSLLAVGNTDGGIVVYDIQKDLAIPSIRPAMSTGMHTGAVWDLKWVARGKGRGEFLMSISADGRVVQWAVGKSIEKIAPDLMHLKRQPGTQTDTTFVEGVAAADGTAGRRWGAQEEAVLSQQCGGMCLDACPADSSVYVVGTEDGSVYQCNMTQTETYDVEYLPHAALVYRVRWSPFSAQFFLTCSADWTSRLYKVGKAQPVIMFDSPTQDAVQDVAWSTANPLTFATVSAKGKVELWSVQDVITPRSSIQFQDHRRLSCVLFAEQDTPVIVVGDEEGTVTVFLLTGDDYTHLGLTVYEQEEWLQEAIRKQTS